MVRKILYTSITPHIGGGEIHLLNLVKGLDKKQFFPIVAVPSQGRLLDRLKAMGVKTKITPLMEFSRYRLFPFLLATIRLAFLIKKEKIDLVHSNSIYVSGQSYFAARLAGVPCVCHIQDLVPILGAGKIRSFAFRKMNKLIAISNAVKRDLTEKLNIPEDKIVRIYHGVDTKEFHSGISGESFRREFNLSSQKLVGMIARFSPEKGQELFLRAAREVLKDYENVNFIVVGDSSLASSPVFEQAMVNLSIKLGMQAKVIFTGFRDYMPGVTAAMDIFVLPSAAEPFGLVTVEAMAMEKPVIATNSGASPEILSKDCGILIEPDNVEQLKQAITELLRNQKLSNHMGKEGRKIAFEKFGIEKCVSEIEKLYNEILK